MKPFSSKIFSGAEGLPEELITINISLPLRSLLAIEEISAITEANRSDVIRGLVDQAIDSHPKKAHIDQIIESELQFMQERTARRNNL